MLRPNIRAFVNTSTYFWNSTTLPNSLTLPTIIRSNSSKPGRGESHYGPIIRLNLAIKTGKQLPTTDRPNPGFQSSLAGALAYTARTRIYNRKFWNAYDRQNNNNLVSSATHLEA